MAMERWAVHLTLESSTKERIKERAREARRSTSNYLSQLIEEEMRIEGKRDERAAG